ncbi:MAG: maleate cis-trans isomerase family protein [Candidatus Limnocylindria bacterium]
MRYGWRARIGQIRPSTGIESSEEWRSVAPDGVAFIDARTMVKTVDERGLEEMMEQVVFEAQKCASARADVIVQCGTPGVFLRGKGYDAVVIAEMEKASGVKCTTMMTAMQEAMRALGMTKIALGSTYVSHVNAKMKAYLEDLGFAVPAVKGLEQLDPAECMELEPEAAYELGRDVFAEAKGADGVVLSCAGMRTFEVIDALETGTGVPVVTSNQAALWQALRLAGIEDRIPKLGRLFREH